MNDDWTKLFLPGIIMLGPIELSSFWTHVLEFGPLRPKVLYGKYELGKARISALA